MFLVNLKARNIIGREIGIKLPCTVCTEHESGRPASNIATSA